MGVQGRGPDAGAAQGAACVRRGASDAAIVQVADEAARDPTDARGGDPMRLNLKIWRQAGPDKPGRLEDYAADQVSPGMSFLEMLDVVNEGLVRQGKDAIAFDSDCREGICGTCGLMVDGIAHGPDRGTTVCQLHMRRFKDGDTITIEPWRAKAFPVVKDLV